MSSVAHQQAQCGTIELLGTSLSGNRFHSGALQRLKQGHGHYHWQFQQEQAGEDRRQVTTSALPPPMTHLHPPLNPSRHGS